MVEFGVSVLKGISGSNNLTRFVLYNRSRREMRQDERVHLLLSIIDRLPIDVQRHFIIDEYTYEVGQDKYKHTYPCITLSRSASGESTDSIVLVYSSLVCLQ